MTTHPLRSLRLIASLAVLLPLAACKQGTDSAGTATAPAATTPAATTPAPAATAAPADTATAPAPVAAEPAHNGPIVPPQGPEPVEGTDYVTIAGGQPYRPLDGKVEVVEVFGYVCPACAQFHPLVSAWEQKLPADVRFTYVPAPFGPEWIPYAKGFYVAEQMGLVGRTHDALVKAIHIDNTMPGEGDRPTDEAVAQFYGKYGVDPKQFLSQMNSFATSAKINRGKQFMMRSGVEGTPTIVVDGKYRITTKKSYDDVLRVAEHLIARERAAMAGGAPAAAPAPAGG